MAKTLCLICREVYDTRNNSQEQKRAGDESFCPSCWKSSNTSIII